MKYYTGVGSRITPKGILELMWSASGALNRLGWTLRSGGAKGADTAFESNASNKEIFYAKDATEEAAEIAKQFHPAWSLLTDYAKGLHARNAFQILGRDLKTPSKFVICWTSDGCKSHQERSISTGGTGTAISIASHYGIKVFNLKRVEDYKRITKWLSYQQSPKG